MLILGIDPGGTTGLALIAVNEKVPTVQWMGTSNDETLLDSKHLFEQADFIVAEDWRTRPGKAMTGGFNQDRMVAPRVIGASRTLAGLLQKPFSLQPASIKPVGYGWSNQKYQKGKKGMHIQDAVAHAVYFGVQNGHCFPVRTS
jgi:hypothetical protein